MAKKRKGGRRRSVSSSVGRRLRRGASRAATNDFTRMLAAGIYGATRGRVNALIAPLVARIPFLGQLTDEAVLIAGSMFVKNRVKNKVAKSYLDAVMLVESSSVGFQLANNGAAAVTSGNANGATGKLF